MEPLASLVPPDGTCTDTSSSTGARHLTSRVRPGKGPVSCPLLNNNIKTLPLCDCGGKPVRFLSRFEKRLSKP